MRANNFHSKWSYPDLTPQKGILRIETQFEISKSPMACDDIIVNMILLFPFIFPLTLELYCHISFVSFGFVLTQKTKVQFHESTSYSATNGKVTIRCD